MKIKKNKALQLQYEGFLSTQLLFEDVYNKGFQVFDIKKVKPKKFNLKINEILRLGKLVERFVSFQLLQDESIQIVTENVQVQKEKLTIGELDCIITKYGQPIHLEIVYKFYLFDKTVSNSEIECWIGPNRRDSLLKKLTKLKEKQLPLLYREETKKTLSQLKLNVGEIIQQIYFKAQLYVPLSNIDKTFNVINTDCIEGFYIHKNEIIQFRNCKFYIPTKLNWLVKPFINVAWLSFEDFRMELQKFIIEKSSPLCWLKKPNGELTKFFVVWW